MKTGFLCFSKYVVFVAYAIKNIYHYQDECILILSDSAQQFDEKFARNVKASGIWSDVITLKEFNEETSEIEYQVDELLRQDINCFYIANIMRCSCHYLTYRAAPDVEIIVMDEGSSTLNLADEYKFWIRKGLPLQWKEFNFEKINKMRVFFPEITKNPTNIPIEFIDLKQLFTVKTPYEIVKEINFMFSYQYKELERSIILIDTHISKTNEYSTEFENYCANQILCMLEPGNIIIKSAPSDSMEYVLDKYPFDEISVYAEKDIPFEVIYLNYIVNRNLPKMVISMPSTLIWNINLLHQAMEIQDVEMISLVGIVKDFNCIPERRKKFWKEQLLYNSVFKEKYKVKIPFDWYALLQIFQTYDQLKEQKTEQDLLKEDNFFLRSSYVKVLEKRNEQSDHTQFLLKKQNAYMDILYKILRLKNHGTNLSQILKEQDISEVVIYGTGIIGKTLYEELKESKITIQCFAQTEKGDYSAIDDKMVLGVDELKDFIQESTVIIITMPFLLEEMKHVLLKYRIRNRVVSLFDMVNDSIKNDALEF